MRSSSIIIDLQGYQADWDKQATVYCSLAGALELDSVPVPWAGFLFMCCVSAAELNIEKSVKVNHVHYFKFAIKIVKMTFPTKTTQ